MVARRYIVSGRVQGVGFRWFVEHEARQLGLAGWVRNNMDGTVEVMAQGTAQQLAALSRKLQQGPRAARVDNVQEQEAVASGSLQAFQIEGAW
jgi:acylphosphatase